MRIRNCTIWKLSWRQMAYQMHPPFTGCRELASDVLLENEAAQQMHQALGFEEAERVVCFRQFIQPQPEP